MKCILWITHKNAVHENYLFGMRVVCAHINDLDEPTKAALFGKNATGGNVEWKQIRAFGCVCVYELAMFL